MGPLSPPQDHRLQSSPPSDSGACRCLSWLPCTAVLTTENLTSAAGERCRDGTRCQQGACWPPPYPPPRTQPRARPRVRGGCRAAPSAGAQAGPPLPLGSTWPPPASQWWPLQCEEGTRTSLGGEGGTESKACFLQGGGQILTGAGPHEEGTARAEIPAEPKKGCSWGLRQAQHKARGSPGHPSRLRLVPPLRQSRLRLGLGEWQAPVHPAGGSPARAQRGPRLARDAG